MFSFFWRFSISCFAVLELLLRVLIFSVSCCGILRLSFVFAFSVLFSRYVALVRVDVILVLLKLVVVIVVVHVVGAAVG